MKIFICDGLPFDVSREVHKIWFKSYKEAYLHYEAEIILCGLHPTDARLYPNAKYFIANCTNTDHITHVHRSQKVIDLKDHTSKMYDITSTAEHTICLMLMLARKQYKPLNGWTRYDYIGTTLAGKTLGILGYGRVGKQVADRAKGLDMKIMAYDKNESTIHTKNDVLMRADFITLHASVGFKVSPVLRQIDIHLIKDGAYIINTSRGCLVDEIALLKNAPRLGGIALDVLQLEPNPKRLKEFKRLKNCILTPHIAGCTMEDMKLTSELVFDLFQGEIDDSTVEPQPNC